MNKEYEVRFVEQIRKDNDGKLSRSGEIQGGDDHFIKSFKTEKAALKYGKKKSFQKTFMKGNKKVHEVYIRCRDEEEDTVENWYIKNGKVTHHDKG
jgi:hypothetical protein